VGRLGLAGLGFSITVIVPV